MVKNIYLGCQECRSQNNISVLRLIRIWNNYIRGTWIIQSQVPLASVHLPAISSMSQVPW